MSGIAANACLGMAERYSVLITTTVAGPTRAKKSHFQTLIRALRSLCSDKAISLLSSSNTDWRLACGAAQRSLIKREREWSALKQNNAVTRRSPTLTWILFVSTHKDVRLQPNRWKVSLYIKFFQTVWCFISVSKPPLTSIVSEAEIVKTAIDFLDQPGHGKPNL